VASGKCLQVLNGGHTPSTLVYSADGARIAAGEEDILRIWDLPNKRLLEGIDLDPGVIQSLAFLPGGRLVALATGEKTCWVWDAEAGLRELGGDPKNFLSLSLSSDGKTLAAGCHGTSAYLWDLARRKPLRVLRGIPWQWAVALSPDGRIIATPWAGERIRLWQVSTGKPLHTYRSPGGQVNALALAFSRDGEQLISGTGEGVVILWRVPGLKLARAVPAARIPRKSKLERTPSAGPIARLGRSSLLHAHGVDRVTFSPDGKTLATEIWQALRLWDVNTGQSRLTFKSYSSFAFSPCSKTLAVGSLDGRVRLWDLRRGKRLRTLGTHGARVRTVVYSRDGKRLASSGGRSIRLWDSITGKQLRVFEGHESVSLSFSPDGSLLASGARGSEGSAQVWATETGKRLFTREGWCWSVTFSPDGSALLLRTDRASMIDTRTWKTLLTLKSSGSFSSSSLSPDGKHLACISHNLLTIVEFRTGKVQLTRKGPLGPNIAYSPDGKSLVSWSDTYTQFRLLETRTGKLLATFAGHQGSVATVAFSPDGRTLASGSEDGSARLWRLGSGCRVTGPVASLAFSPDGKTLAAGQGNAIRIWNLGARKVLEELHGHTEPVSSVDFSPDGRTLASGSRDQTTRLWVIGKRNAAPSAARRLIRKLGSARYTRRATAQRRLRLLELLAFPDLLSERDHSDLEVRQRVRRLLGGLQILSIRTLPNKQLRSMRWPVNALCFSPDGRKVAVASRQMAAIWGRGNPAKLEGTDSHEFYALAFSPDGKLLAAGGSGGTVGLWNPHTGKRLRVFNGHSAEITAMAYSPVGNVFASASQDKTVRLWQPRTGKCLRLFDGHDDEVTSVSFSPDGKILASGSKDGSVRLWAVRNRKLLRTFSGNSGAVWSIAFSPDGRLLAAGYQNSCILLWKIAIRRGE